MVQFAFRIQGRVLSVSGSRLRLGPCDEPEIADYQNMENLELEKLSLAADIAAATPPMHQVVDGHLAIQFAAEKLWAQ